jgi:hypothetical protein
MKIEQDIKNTLVVMMDTSKKESIQIGKMDHQPPSTEEEMKAMMLLDIATLCEAMVVMIRTAHQMGAKPEADSMRDVIEHLNAAFVDSEMKVEYRGSFSDSGK